MFSNARLPSYASRGAKTPTAATPSSKLGRVRPPASFSATSSPVTPSSSSAAAPASRYAFTPTTSTAPSSSSLATTRAAPSSAFAGSAKRAKLGPTTPSTAAVPLRYQRTVLQENDRHRVEGICPLPTAVVKYLNTITEEEEYTAISGSVDGASGFAWIIIRNTLFLWQYLRVEEQGHSQQFQLPSSKYAYDGNLVAIVPGQGATGSHRAKGVKGLLVCSREGIIRYWPNVEHNTTLESSLDLSAHSASGSTVSSSSSGEKKPLATRLISLGQAGHVLGTNQGTLFHIVLWQPSTGCCLNTRPIVKPVGMLAGLGRRLFSFGKALPPSAVVAMAQGAGAAISDSSSSSASSELFVLTETSLQRWRIFLGTQERMLYETGLHDLIKKKLVEEDELERARREEEEEEIGGGVGDLWLLDMQRGETGVYVLVAYSDLNSAQQERTFTYCIVEVKLYHPDSGEGISPELGNLLYLQPPTEPVDEEDLLTARAVRLIVPAGGPCAYVNWPSIIVLMKVPEDERPLDWVTLKGSKSEVIIGAGSGPMPRGSIPSSWAFSPSSTRQQTVASNEVFALFLSLQYGILAVSQYGLVPRRRDITEDKPAPIDKNEATLSLPSSSLQTAVHEDLRVADVQIKHLVAAFYQYLAGETLPQEAPLMAAMRSSQQELSNAVQGVSNIIVDAKPQSNPRWAEDTKKGAIGEEEEEEKDCAYSEAQSLLLREQLAEKIQKHATFIGFLFEMKLWDKISTTAKLVLFAHSEKLQAAAALRDHHNALAAELSSNRHALKALQKTVDSAEEQARPDFDALTQSKARVKAGRVKMELLQKAIRLWLASSSIPSEFWSETTGLAPEDMFYSHVSAVDELLGHLQGLELNALGPILTRTILSTTAEVQLSSEGSARATLPPSAVHLSSIDEIERACAIIEEVDFVFEAILLTAVEHRRSNTIARDYPSQYLQAPWTSSEQLRTQLSKQAKLTVHILQSLQELHPEKSSSSMIGAPGTNTALSFERTEQVMAMMLSQLFHLEETLLDGFVEELSILSRRITQQQRKKDDDEEEEAERLRISHSTLEERFHEARTRAISAFRSLAKVTSTTTNKKSNRKTTSVISFYNEEAEEEDEEELSVKAMARNYAVQLAEKFKDFNSLIALCCSASEHHMYGGESATETAAYKNRRLQEYMHRFKEDNFAEHLFQWLIMNGKRTALLTQPEEYNDQLSKFLEAAAYQQYAWIHALKVGNYSCSAKVLRHLADEEDRRVGRKKTLLSIGKLACIADSMEERRPGDKRWLDTENYMGQADQLLYLIKVQEKYRLAQRDSTLASQNVSLSPPMSFQDIIDAFIGEATPSAQQFVLALDVFRNSDLLRNEEENKALLRLIWQRAFLCTDWRRLAADWERGKVSDADVEMAIKKGVFFRTACNREVRGLFNIHLFQEIMTEYLMKGKRAATTKPTKTQSKEKELIIIDDEEDEEGKEEEEEIQERNSILARLLKTVLDMIAEQLEKGEEVELDLNETEEYGEEGEEEKEESLFDNYQEDDGDEGLLPPPQLGDFLRTSSSPISSPASLSPDSLHEDQASLFHDDSFDDSMILNQTEDTTLTSSIWPSSSSSKPSATMRSSVLATPASTTKLYPSLKALSEERRNWLNVSQADKIAEEEMKRRQIEFQQELDRLEEEDEEDEELEEELEEEGEEEYEEQAEELAEEEQAEEVVEEEPSEEQEKQEQVQAEEEYGEEVEAQAEEEFKEDEHEQSVEQDEEEQENEEEEEQEQQEGTMLVESDQSEAEAEEKEQLGEQLAEEEMQSLSSEEEHEQEEGQAEAEAESNEQEEADLERVDEEVEQEEQEQTYESEHEEVEQEGHAQEVEEQEQEQEQEEEEEEQEQEQEQEQEEEEEEEEQEQEQEQADQQEEAEQEKVEGVEQEEQEQTYESEHEDVAQEGQAQEVEPKEEGVPQEQEDDQEEQEVAPEDDQDKQAEEEQGQQQEHREEPEQEQEGAAELQQEEEQGTEEQEIELEDEHDAEEQSQEEVGKQEEQEADDGEEGQEEAEAEAEQSLEQEEAEQEVPQEQEDDQEQGQEIEEQGDQAEGEVPQEQEDDQEQELEEEHEAEEEDQEQEQEAEQQGQEQEPEPEDEPEEEAEQEGQEQEEPEPEEEAEQEGQEQAEGDRSTEQPEEDASEQDSYTNEGDDDSMLADEEEADDVSFEE